jgi:hypothetical protein
VWFCKHLKYCGVDNDLSRAIVSLEEDNSDLEESAGKKYTKRGVSIASEYYKDTPDRLRITGTGMSPSQNGPDPDPDLEILLNPHPDPGCS